MEWIAPILAHANIAYAASGIIGIYKITLSPFPTPNDLYTLANLET